LTAANGTGGRLFGPAVFLRAALFVDRGNQCSAVGRLKKELVQAVSGFLIGRLDVAFPSIGVPPGFPFLASFPLGFLLQFLQELIKAANLDARDL
jgi:hypothetical protein